MEDLALPMSQAAVAPNVWRRNVRRVIARWSPAALSMLRGSLWNLGSLAIALGAWQLVCLTISPDSPTPLASFRVCLELLGTAFTKESGRLGIGYQVLASLRRIAI